jgi:NADPH-dependent curcumin reductase CurA
VSQKFIGEPKAGETLVVAAATGPVGSTVGQVGKLLGCRVVGIAGGLGKCRFAVDTLGFDACIDHREDGFASALAGVCVEGIDIYLENVGGKLLDAVLPLQNDYARIPVCGLVSQYNATRLPDARDRLNWLMGQILSRKLRVQGFIIFDSFGNRYG